MAVTSSQLGRIATYLHEPKLSLYADLISKSMHEFGITTDSEQAQFIAQIMHESCECRCTTELASGEAYEGRHDLGNTLPGSGVKYKGRGLIQITGYNNYVLVGTALGLDLVNHPELLAEPENATRSAAWFWSKHRLDYFADQGTTAAFITETKRINGGTNGLSDRETYWGRAKKEYGIA